MTPWPAEHSGQAPQPEESPQPGTTSASQPDEDSRTSAMIGRRLHAFKADLHNPLYRNAYLLMANTVLSGLLGLVYWTVAARLFSVETVGRGAALVTTMQLISAATQLNFGQALIRFLPRAGRSSASLVAVSYLISAALAATVAFVVLIVVALVASSSNVLHLGMATGVLFIAATMAWSIFNLQDAALTALRRPFWVLVENTSFGLVKVVMLVFAGTLFAGYPVFGSWTIPVAASIVPVNIAIFWLFLPHHEKRTDSRRQPIIRKAVAKFMAGDYAGNLSAQLSTTLLPVLVVSILGTVANGYFYAAQVMSTALDLLAINLGSSLTVEAADDESRIAELTRAVLKKTMIIVAPIAIVIAVGAPLFLQIYRPEYSSHASTLLRLLVLASIPRAVVAVYSSLCRLQKRTHWIGAVEALQASLIVGLSVLLMPAYGIDGVGIAALISQLAVMSICLRPMTKALAIYNPRHAKGRARKTGMPK